MNSPGIGGFAIQCSSQSAAECCYLSARHECERIAAALGDKNAMILRNHGLLAAGDTVGQAFALMRKLEESCAVQVMAQAGGAKLNIPPMDIVQKTATQATASLAKPQLMGADNATSKKDVAWDAMRRLMDRMYPDYRD